MKNRAVILSALLIVTVAAIGTWLLVFRSGPRVSGPLRHEVYVWQRAWTPPVRNAVAQHATNFASLVLLKAEVSWKDKQPLVVRVLPDYATLTATRQPIGLALRIGPYAGPFTAPTESGNSLEGRARHSVRAAELRGDDGAHGVTRPTNSPVEGDTITLFLADLAASLVAEARTNHVLVSELQIDFDCAESKLDGYRLWVEAIQHRVAPLPVTITALPSWLDAPAFKRLAMSASNYVLQVHSLDRPANIHTPFTLCDPRAAQRAVQRAGRIGVPFRVALPTYGYVLAFDRAGKFIGLSAEGPRKTWPEGTQLREVNSNPIELAALVREWTANRPAALRGVIWYRLPVETDKLNWSWETLREILSARLTADNGL